MAEFNQQSQSYSDMSVNNLDNLEIVSWSIDTNPATDLDADLIINYIVSILTSFEPTIPFINEMAVINEMAIICEPLEISEEQQNCCICMEIKEKEDICLVNCGHSFCGECIKNTYNKNRNFGCPLCRESVFVITTQKPEIKEQIDGLI